jgi:chemotaxis protein methyltransferase CheR
MPEALRRTYFTPAADGKSQICAAARELVQFGRLDLKEESASLHTGDVDVIFCRNVLVHMDGASKSAVIERFVDSLKDGGFLFLGACESLLRLNNHFRVVHFPGAIAYWKLPFGSILR